MSSHAPRRRALLSPVLPMLLLFAVTLPLWLEESALSSIRSGLLTTTVPVKQQQDAVNQTKKSLRVVENAVKEPPTSQIENEQEPTTNKTKVSREASQVVETVKITSTNDTTNTPREAVNVLFGLSGTNKDFLAEFEVSLKSVLLNAPIHADLNVHVLADKKAYDQLPKIFDNAKLKGSKWVTPISINTYNVSPHVSKWTKTITNLYQKKIGRVTRHTIGAYFRLFANDVLPESVTHVVYLDTDVVVMSNLGDLWVRFNRNATFSWGKDHCSGFVVFNVPKLPTIWELAKEYDFRRKASGDQFILKNVGKMHPEVVSHLPSEWAISIGNGLWRHAKHIVSYRPKVGQFHFNGQGAKKQSWWRNKNGFPYKFDKTFGAALYYVNLPWTWARFNGESLAAGGQKYKLVIHHKKESKSKTDTVKEDEGLHDKSKSDTDKARTDRDTGMAQTDKKVS